MERGAVRLLSPPLKTGGYTPVWLVLIMLFAIVTPMPAADASIGLDSDDFGVVEQLHDMLAQRAELLTDDGEAALADRTIADVHSAIRPSGSADPLANIEGALEGTTFVDTRPILPEHPPAYQMLMAENGQAPGGVDNIWQTLLNISDYVIWSRYVDKQGIIEDNFTVVTFSASLFSLFSASPLLHDIDVDNDGVTDVQTGLSVSWDAQDGWGIAGSPPTELWVEPTIEFAVETAPNKKGDQMWEDMQYLRISLIKQFAYSSNPFEDGESYVWVIDTRFTNEPDEFSLEVGLERFWFDISEAGADFLAAITLGLLFGNPDESAVRIAAISAPYAIHIVNGGEAQNCRQDYSPVFDKDVDPVKHGCGVTAGFGYLHLGPPVDLIREVWEVAYIEVSTHPNGDLVILPSQVDIVIRTDSVLSSTIEVAGEGGLTTIEYHADQAADIFIHFFEDRSQETPNDPTAAYGNITESSGWLKGMPAGSLERSEIERIFRMLGSESQPELPGQIPNQLGLIIGVKNFSRDTSPNANDSSLPVNPANPPKSLILIRSVSSVESIEYTSWFLRQGAIEDHRRADTRLKNLPTSLVLYGSFDIGGGGDDTTNVSLDDAANLDFLSRMLDVTILNLVDLFIDVGQVLNSVPEAVGSALTGGGGGGGAGGLAAGSEFHLEMSDDWRLTRQPMAMGVLAISLGSSPHPIFTGDHMLLANDRDLNLVQGRRAAMGPLMPVGFSVKLSNISGADIRNEAVTDIQHISLRLGDAQPLRIGFIEHDAGTLNESTFHIIESTRPPDSLALTIEGTSVDWNASSPIQEMLYFGKDGDEQQAIRLRHLPRNFSTSFGGDLSWLASEPISSIEFQISNSANPLTMDGDHFLYDYDPASNTSSLSGRLTNVSRASWTPPLDAEAAGVDGRASASLNVDGNESFKISIEHPADYDEPTRGLSVHALIDPLPSSMTFDVPASGDGFGPSLEVPEFNTTTGLRGIARFIDGFSVLGTSLNYVLADMTETLTGRSGEPSSTDFSYGLKMAAGSGFNLTMEAVQGRLPLATPDWHHGVGIVADEVDNETGYHIRAWLPGLPPELDASITYSNQSALEQWAIRLDMEGWEPARDEFVLEVNGFEGQDLSLTFIGFTPGISTSLSVDTTLSTEVIGPITDVTVSSHYEMSTRLEAVHASLLDRELGIRSELFVKDIPREIDLQAKTGSEISVALTVPESEQQFGRSVESVMMQTMQWADGEWWPATIFLNDVPGTIDLTSASSKSFDITKSTSLQGTSEFEFSASASGMDLFMDVTGRSVNERGDTLMMADDLTDRLSIYQTETYGLGIRSGGAGLGRLYIKMSDIPVREGVHLDQMEALGENLKSATIEIHEIAGLYPIVVIDDVQGGRIIINARASVEVGGRSLDARAVLIDAQTTSYIPTGTTVGVNGLASDLSILNILPGFDGSTSHVLAPEPLSTVALTLGVTLFGGAL